MSQLVLHMHQTTFNKSAVTDHGFFIVIITGGEREKKKEKKEEAKKTNKKATFLKASAFLSSFGRPSSSL